MKVYCVGVSDCEGFSLVAVCATKEVAEKKLFAERDRLIKEWQRYHEHNLKEGYDDQMYPEMISNLSSNDYKNWQNFPHDCPCLFETEVLED